LKKLDHKNISAIVIHCSASARCTKQDLQLWHIAQNGWSDIGYHFLIEKNGHVEKCRSLMYAGAHVKGDNSHTIGICLEGRGNYDFTDTQINALREKIKELLGLFPNAGIRGHFEYDSAKVQGKTCPLADGEKWDDFLGRMLK
jgi:N-acetyl-anhydromuramyl-L-alanine amidase AmpD